MPHQVDAPDLAGRPTEVTPDAASAPGQSPNGSADVGLADLAGRLASLKVRFLEVVGQMEQVAATMREPGAPPDYHIVQALGECHRQFLRIRHEVIHKAAALGVKIRSTERLAGLTDIEAFLETLSESAAVERPPAREYRAPVELATPAPEAETLPVPDVARAAPVFAPELLQSPVEAEAEPPALSIAHGEPTIAEPWSILGPAPAPLEPAPALPVEVVALPEPVEEETPLAAPAGTGNAGDDSLRHAALGVLDKALRLALRDGGEWPALSAFHDQAAQLRAAIASCPHGALPAAAGALAAGVHPLARLANAVEGKEELSDADWADVHVVVTESFGRPLAVALARQRLVVRPAS
jgi:hypothetical protein